jgi:predicted RNA-binding Zn ribbon-like protein
MDPSDFPLIGEPLALDLINTRLGTADGDRDLLTTPAALSAWLATQAGRLAQPDSRLTANDLAAVRAIRADVTVAVQHAQLGKRPPASVLRSLTDAQRAAPAYRELGWDGAAVTAVARRGGDYASRLVAELADAAADLLTSPTITTVRKCEGAGCVLLFLPAHPRRRWCSSALCGNRVRVARYYRRHKQS